MNIKFIKASDRFVDINVIKLGTDNFVIFPNDSKKIQGSLKETLKNLKTLGLNENQIVLGFKELLNCNVFKISFGITGTFLISE